MFILVQCPHLPSYFSDVHGSHGLHDTYVYVSVCVCVRVCLAYKYQVCTKYRTG